MPFLIAVLKGNGDSAIKNIGHNKARNNTSDDEPTDYDADSF